MIMMILIAIIMIQILLILVIMIILLLLLLLLLITKQTCNKKEQIHSSPEGSKDIDDVIIVGDRCIHKWGYDPAVRGKGVKVKCNCCGATVNKSGNKYRRT